MSTSIPVTFCPVKAVPYEDSVTFSTAHGDFDVALRGLMPEVDLEVPSAVDFGYSLCQEKHTHRVSVRNVGRAPVKFSWVVAPPFSISPAAGELPPDGEAVLACSFTPDSASVFTSAAVCKIAGGPSVQMMMQGIGKYSFLRLAEEVVNFGEVLPYAPVERTVALHNLSTVEAKFSIPPDAARGSEFRVTPTQATVPPSGSLPLKVRYTPTTPDSALSEVFPIQAVGGNALSLTCKGSCVGPDVSLSARCLDFGQTASGRKAKRAFMIQNRSKAEVDFQLSVDGAGVFHVDVPRGTLPAMGSLLVNVTFAPEVPAQYHRRLFCLVMNSAEVVCADLIGTCFTASVHPDPIQEWHLAPAAGAAPTPRDGPRFSPGPGSPDPWGRGAPTTPGGESAMLAQAMEMADLSSIPDTNLGDYQREVVGEAGAAGGGQWDELFGQGQRSADGLLTLDTGTVRFGGCSRLRLAPNKTITVTNHTRERQFVHWGLPSVEADLEPAGRVFNVFPETAEVGPGQSAQFRVAFRPKRDNAAYSGQLELFAVAKKALQSHLATGVSPNRLIRPYALVVQAVGHTFQAARIETSPMVAASTEVLEFPPCYDGGQAVNLVAVTNHGSTTVAFDASVSSREPRDGPTAPFCVYPESGLLPAGGRLLLAVRFRAVAPGDFSGKLKILLNGTSTLPVELRGLSCRPSLRLGSEGTLYLKPTCVGASSTSVLPLHNPTRVPVAFAWDLPEPAQALLRPTPLSGVIPGGESLDVEWAFAPRKARDYSLAVPLSMGAPQSSAVGGPAMGSEKAVLRVVGQGTAGGVRVVSGPADLGTVRIGDARQGSVSVVNESQGVLQYLAVPFRVLADGSEALERGGQLEVSGMRGTLPALVEEEIGVEFRPATRCRYHFRVKLYSTGGLLRDPDLGSMDPADPTGLGLPCAAEFEVFASGQHPMLQITDLQCRGLQKSLGWEMANAGAINLELGTALSDAELETVSALAMGQVSVTDILKGLRPTPVFLAPGTVGGEDSVLRLMVKNTSELEADWSISLPHENNLDMESWVQPRFPPDDISQMEHLFDISPRAGSVAPGAEQEVELRFRHDSVTERQLPLLLYVNHGKCVRLELVGRTLAPGQALLAHQDVHHELAPRTLGDADAPLQTVTLYNQGLEDVAFEIDTAELAELRRESHDFDVLRMLTPATGTIPARGHLVTWWEFRPLDAREYVVRLPVLVGGEPSHDLVVHARGVAPGAVRGELDGLASISALLDGHRPAPPAFGLSPPAGGAGEGAGGEGQRGSEGGGPGGDAEGGSEEAGPGGDAEPGVQGELSLTGMGGEGPGAAPSLAPGSSLSMVAPGGAPQRAPTPPGSGAPPGRPVTARPGTRDEGPRLASTLGLAEETGESMGSAELPLMAGLRDRDALLSMSQDVLDMGRMSRAAVSRAVVVLENTKSVPVRFNWSLGDYAGGGGDDLFDGKVAVEPAEGVIRPSERCLVKFEVRAGARLALFDGCVSLQAMPLQAELNPRDIARISRERPAGRADPDALGRSVKQRPGITGFPGEGSMALPLDGIDGPLDGPAGEAPGAPGSAPAAAPQRQTVRIIGEVHAEDDLLPPAAMMRRLALRELEEAQGGAAGAPGGGRAGDTEDEVGVEVGVLASVLEDALAALAKDPAVFAGALVQQPPREGGGDAPGDAAAAGGEGSERRVEACLARVADLEAQMFAEFVLESAVFSVLQESAMAPARGASTRGGEGYRSFPPTGDSRR